MELFQIIFPFVLILLLIAREGSRNAYGICTDEVKRKKLSNEWHTLGWIIRAGVVGYIVVILFPQWFLTGVMVLIYLNLDYTFWDGWIAIRMGRSFWFTGTTATTDKLLGWKISKIAKIVLFFVTVIAVAIYFIQ